MKLQRLEIDKVLEIYSKHYANEFPAPNFNDRYVSTFQVVDDKENIITSGGIRLIPEIVLVTDLDAHILDRKQALKYALDYMIYDSKQLNLDVLHVFVDKPQWKHRLERSGFKAPKGECLILEVL